jgi:hypothetical protein
MPPEGDAPASDDTSTLPPGHPLAGAVPVVGDENTTYTANVAPSPTPPTTPPASDTDLAKEVEKWKNLAQKHEARARANATASAELERLRQESMTETEKAVAAAKAAGRSEALAEVGGQLVVSQLRAAAAGRVDTKVLNAVLANLNVAAFMGDDGQPDTAAIAAFVESIAPPPAQQEESNDPRWPDLGQGQQGTPPLNSSGLERALMQTVNRA